MNKQCAEHIFNENYYEIMDTERKIRYEARKDLKYKEVTEHCKKRRLR